MNIYIFVHCPITMFNIIFIVSATEHRVFSHHLFMYVLLVFYTFNIVFTIVSVQTFVYVHILHGNRGGLVRVSEEHDRVITTAVSDRTLREVIALDFDRSQAVVGPSVR